MERINLSKEINYFNLFVLKLIIRKPNKRKIKHNLKCSIKIERDSSEAYNRNSHSGQQASCCLGSKGFLSGYTKATIKQFKF